ncbi:MAG: transporter [Phenylobacterium sp.]|nr:transporter [Phenylobacterium sp.]
MASLRRPPPPARNRRFARLAGLGMAVSVAGCAVGPNYHRPSAPITPRFKEAAGWRPSDPADQIDRGAWWSMFNDPVLDDLERRVATSNQTVKEFEAVYRQAHAIVAEGRSAFFPTLSGVVDLQRSHNGGGTNATTTPGTGTAVTVSPSGTTTAAVGQLEAAWVPDLWGRVRRTVESEKALAQVGAAEIANARLSAQAILAEDYFQLRVLDEEAVLFRDTIAGYRIYLQIVRAQYQEGTQPLSAVLAAQTQLYSAEATLIAIGVTRAQMEHAIAVLTGAPPATHSIPPVRLSRNVPVPPISLPSTLLERRPDIAVAERQVASANAQVGVAISAYFPSLTLSGAYGESASSLGNLFNAATSFWSLGAAVSETLLDFGFRRGQVAAARAFYDEQVATYRQTVLTAFQSVEDELAAARIFQQQEAVLLQTEAAARETVQLTLAEYRAGTVDYTTVITAQAIALTASLNVLTVLQQRLIASVLLVEDLGGGWSAAELPKS